MKAVVLSTLFAVGLAHGASAWAQELKVGDPAPDFKLQATDGKTYQAVGLQGQAGGRRWPGSPRRSRRAARSSASRSRRTAT